MLPRPARIACLALLSSLGMLGCRKSGASSSPNVVERTASDVETEVRSAPQTAEDVADEVGDTANDVVESVAGPSGAPAPKPSGSEEKGQAGGDAEATEADAPGEAGGG